MYDIKAPFLLYNGLISVIKEMLRKKNSGLKLVKFQGPVLSLNIRILIKGCKDIYSVLNRREEHVKIKTQTKWNLLFEQRVLNWKLIYNAPFKCMKSRKFQWFQYRINHNIIILYVHVQTNFCVTLVNLTQQNVRFVNKKKKL